MTRLPLVVMLVFAVGACRGHPLPTARHRVRAHPVDASRVADADDAAAEPTAAELPASLAGPLATCVTRVGHDTPPELAAALATVEYPSVAEDACRMDLAQRFRDRALCDGIALTQVREACLWRVSVAVGDVSQCPDALGERGRDPTCVALATRSRGLCAGALPADRVRCLAMAEHDVTHCAPLDPLLRPRCERDVTLSTPAFARLTGIPFREGTLTMDYVLGAVGDAGVPATHAVSTELARGAFVTPEHTLLLLDAQRGWPDELMVMSTDEPPAIGVVLDVPAHHGNGTVREVRVVFPHGVVVDSASGAMHATAHWTAIEGHRGGRVAGTVTVDIVSAGTSAHLVLAFDTFVRDEIDAAIVR